MSTRGPLARVLVGACALCVALLALLGGVALRGSGVIAVLLAGGVAACVAAGVARETPGPRRRGVLETAGLVGAGTVGVLLAISGTAALAGGIVAATVTGVGGLAALALWMLRVPRSGGRARSRTSPRPLPGSGPVVPPRPLAGPPRFTAPPVPAGRADAAGAARVLPPVADLPTDALGREWLRSSAALAGRLEPAVRECIVRRRQDALDELERRDPVGFARWLAGGPAPGSNPADFVRGKPAAGSDAA